MDAQVVTRPAPTYSGDYGGRAYSDRAVQPRTNAAAADCQLISDSVLCMVLSVSTSKQIKLEQRVSHQQKGIVGELQALSKDIERCESTVHTLKTELEKINSRHANRATTQDDIAYLEDLLACAKKKLVWEKQIASLQKRTPDLMQRVEALVNHPQSNPDEEARNTLMHSLKEVQSAMQRLNQAKI